MTQYRLSQSALSDIIEILAWSQSPSAKGRDFATKPSSSQPFMMPPPAGTASAALHALNSVTASTHGNLRQSRDQTSAGVVLRPRHLLIYRVDVDTAIVVGRVLHDAMELRRHLGQTSWE
ncbi:MAG: hypothetical protein ACR2JU_08090 [Nocardioidaceae bacterium]